MKRFLLLIFLGSLLSCLKKDVSTELPTSDALYRSWRLTEVLYDRQPMIPDPYITEVTFPRDGDFRGNLPKDNRWCCTPVAFEGTNARIRFIWDKAAPACASLNCQLSPLWEGVDWQIINLTDKRLILQGDKITLSFESIH